MEKFEINGEGQVASQKVNEPVQPGVYDVEVRNAFIYTNDNGNKFVQFEFSIPSLDDRQLFVSSFVAKPDGTQTYERNGKKFYYKGLQDLIYALLVTTGKDNIEGETEYVEFFDKKIQAFVIKPLIGKKLKIGVRHEESFYNGKFKVKPVVAYWMSLDGENENGENIEEKVIKNIQKNPVKEAANKGAATPAKPGNTEVPKGFA